MCRLSGYGIWISWVVVIYCACSDRVTGYTKTHKTHSRSRCLNILLRVSALHYSAGDWVTEGFGQWLQLVCCANLLLRVWVFLELSSTSLNLIGTEHSLNRSEHRVRVKQAKSNLNGWNLEYRGFPIDLGFRIRSRIFPMYRYWKSKYSQCRESDYGDGCRKWPEVE